MLLSPTMDQLTPLAISGFGALALLLISLAVSAFRSQRADSKEIITKLDAVKETGSEQAVTLARMDERFTSVESRVDDLHKRRNDEQERVFTLAAEALMELRDHKRRRGDHP